MKPRAQAILLALVCGAPCRSEEAAGDAIPDTKALEGAVLGRVLDAEGRPLRGAHVEGLASLHVHYGSDEGPGGMGVGATTCAADGSYRLAGEKGGLAWIRVSHPGFEQRWLRVEVPSRAVDLRLERLAIVQGHVRGPNGGPVPGFKVRALGHRGREWLYDGAEQERSQGFELTLPKGRYVLQAEAPGLAPSRSGELALKPGEKREGLLIDLLPEALIEGNVFARVSGRPLDQVTVTFKPRANFWLPFVARTDAEGAFRLEGLPPGDYELWGDPNDLYHDRGLCDSTVVRGSLRPAEKKKVELKIGSGGALDGFFRVGGVAAPKACRLSNVELSRGGTRQRGLGMDAAGRFEAHALEPGQYEVSAWGSFEKGESFQVDRRIAVVEGETTRLEIDVGPRLPVAGRLQLGTFPAGGLLVQAMDPWRPVDLDSPWQDQAVSSSRTDAKGNYQLRLPGGSSWFLFVLPGGKAWLQSEVSLPPEADAARQDITLGAERLAGTVVEGAAGDPVEGAMVELFARGETARSHRSLAAMRRAGTQTDGAGCFELPFLSPGEYSVRVAALRYAEARLDDVRIEKGRGATEVTVKLATGFPIWLRTVDTGGYPVSGARVILRDSRGSLVNTRAWGSKGDPMELAVARPGSYEVTILHPDFAPARVPVTVTMELLEAEVTLSRGGKLTVHVTDRADLPVDRAEVSLENERGEELADDLLPGEPWAASPLLSILTEADGTLRWAHVVPGVHRVSARRGKLRSQESTVTVEEGKAAEVRLKLEN